MNFPCNIKTNDMLGVIRDLFFQLYAYCIIQIIQQMQTPRTSQFTRKPRKQISRDRKEVGGLLGARQRSKDSEDRKAFQENSPNKPHQLISNLRFELTNLRQQVAKLSKRQSKKPIAAQQVRQQYDMRSPKQPKQMYSYYFDQVKSTLPEEEPISQRSEDEGRVRSKSKARADEAVSLRLKVEEIQVKNNELVRANSELSERMREMGERLRRQYDSKIHQIQNQKQRLSRQKETLENDRTINYQKQVLDNKKHIEELNERITALTKDNQTLKKQVEKYKEYQEQVQEQGVLLLEREGRIGELNIIIQSLKIEIAQVKQEVNTERQERRLMREEKNKLSQSIKESASTIEDLKAKLQATTKKNIQLEKKTVKPQKIETQPQQKRKSKTVKLELPLDIKQLHQIITVQQKSLLNQQSDINYLQGEVRKLSFLKHMGRVNNQMVESLNQEIVKLNLSHLSRKYCKQ